MHVVMYGLLTPECAFSLLSLQGWHLHGELQCMLKKCTLLLLT
jgi:hypothetical protein